MVALTVTSVQLFSRSVFGVAPGTDVKDSCIREYVSETILEIGVWLSSQATLPRMIAIVIGVWRAPFSSIVGFMCPDVALFLVVIHSSKISVSISNMTGNYYKTKSEDFGQPWSVAD